MLCATRRQAIAGVTVLAAGCGRRAPDLVEGEEGRIARIQDGDALALDTGLRVRLAEVEAPAVGFNDRPGEPFAEEAEAILTAAALGRRAQLYYGGLSRDRYDRAIAHAIASDETGADIWLNGLVVRQGGARVRSFPDNARRVRRLYALEAEARAAKRGLWALDHYRIRSGADLADAPNYAILEGPLLELKETAAEGVALIGPAGFRLDAASLGKPDIALEAGKPIRLRGRVDTRAEPRIRLTHWGQVEAV